MTKRSLFACAVLGALLLTGILARAVAPGVDAAAALHEVQINARDLKTLHYMQNAHGQLEEWSLRLLSRLEQGMGPREREPILDGRADLQVKKIAVTYSLYSKTPQLTATLEALADAHAARLVALQRMVTEGADRDTYERLDQPVQDIVIALRTWSEKHEQ